jgi:transcriptional regulator with XRE-family HTH domain
MAVPLVVGNHDGCDYYALLPTIGGSRAHTAAIHNCVVPRRKPPVEKPPPRPAVLRLLGAQLRRLRLERELSQERLAELAGLNYKYLGRIELAKADPGADVLVRLARALAVPVGQLFETITPADSTAYRLSPADVDGVAAAVTALTTIVDRVRRRQPYPLPARAPRRARR